MASVKERRKGDRTPQRSANGRRRGAAANRQDAGGTSGSEGRNRAQDRNWSRLGAGLGAAALATGAALVARRMRSNGDAETAAFENRLETDETMRLISSKKVEGTPVVDRDGKKVGTIDSFMVDKYTGRVAYAVMKFGGRFGMGSSLFPLPWPMLDYDETKGGYLLDITRQALARAPRFQPSKEPEFDPEYRRKVILFYRPSAAGTRSGRQTGLRSAKAGAPPGPRPAPKPGARLSPRS